MSEIKVTAKELERTAQELQQLNEQFKSQVANLESLEGVLATQWVGDAQKAFHTAFLRDKQQMDTFYTEINKYVTALQTDAVKYSKMEAENEMIASS